MITTVRPSVRSMLIAGMSAGLVGAAVLLPTNGPQPVGAVTAIDFSPFKLSASVTSTAAQIVPTATNPITEAYDRVEPWVAYGFELAEYALSVVPVLWWVAPGVDLAYFSIEPLVQAAVYSVSYVLFGQFDQIPQAISNGIEEAAQNFVDYSIAWIGSLIPLPPIPPFPPTPPFPGAATTAGPAAVIAKRSVPGSAQATTAPEADDAVLAAGNSGSGAATENTVISAEVDTTVVTEEVTTPAAVDTTVVTEEVTTPAEVDTVAPRAPVSRAARIGQTVRGEDRSAADKAAASAAQSIGTSGKANGARASRGASRAG